MMQTLSVFYTVSTCMFAPVAIHLYIYCFIFLVKYKAIKDKGGGGCQDLALHSTVEPHVICIIVNGCIRITENNMDNRKNVDFNIPRAKEHF